MENQTSSTNPGSNKNIIILVVVIAAVLLIGVGGYFVYRAVANKIAEVSIEKLIESQSGQKVDIDRDGQTLKITTDEGEQLEYAYDEEGSVNMKFSGDGQEGNMIFRSDEKGIDVPDSLKNALPIFTPSKMIALNDLQAMGVTGTFTTDKSKDEILSFYLKEMPQQDWKKQAQYEIDDNLSLSFTKGSDSATVIIFEEDDQTQFMIGYYKQ
ncbi:MAG: hypothetical protein ACOZBH_00560 [Patescibacteria group bacterium]